MRFGAIPFPHWVIVSLALALSVAYPLLAHGGSSAAISTQREVFVPFVGCKSDGQAGPVDAPKGGKKAVAISAEAAEQLAYYEAEYGFGALAPRGWHCLEVYGSGGGSLLVSPEPIDRARLFSKHWSGIPRSAVEVSVDDGRSSGIYRAAEVIARVFPAYRSIAVNAMRGFDPPANRLTFHPYPQDTLTYRSKSVVEYETPPQTEGLGTHSFLKKNKDPIAGVAILAGQNPDLILLSVRLPSDQIALTRVIVDQIEREVARTRK
jgi:hypothetical protein